MVFFGDPLFFGGLSLSDFFGKFHCLYFVFVVILSVFCRFIHSLFS